MKKNKNDIIREFGTREVKTIGLASFINFVEENGLAVITTHNQPRCMVMPLTLVGFKKVLKQMEALFEDNINYDDDELIVRMRSFSKEMNEMFSKIE